MITYKEALDTKNGLIALGWPDARISAVVGNGSNADNEKYDSGDDNYPEGFTPDEAYPDFSINFANDKASVKELRRRFKSRGDGLNDFVATAAEYPLVGGVSWMNVLLDWPTVRAACAAKLEQARQTMGV